MAVYVYRCSECGIVELHRSIYDNSMATCPKCGNADVVRQYQPVGITFKGKGFYKTDNKNNS